MKIAVLLSGGVDSTIAALCLKEQGYELLGLTMVNWDMGVGDKAAEAARMMGIEHKIVDMRGRFKESVVDYFCSAYEKGQTPNPCVECNKYIKFGALLEKAQSEGCDMVATGHYAQVEFDSDRQRYLLKKGVDSKKDQSYFLYGLTQEQLAHIHFPLGRFSKDEVRALARQKGMKSAESPESQEICFIPGDYREFLKGRIECHSGEIRDTEGRLLGKHQGLAFYTIGQRKGLGISGGKPLYVVDMDIKANILMVGDNQDLFRSSLIASRNNFIYYDRIDCPMQVQAKIRYAAKPEDATIYMEDNLVRVEFAEPQRAVTPGQSVVYYLGEYVLGGGLIC
ncbi:MAG: tRNA 2-thiouridine(34) synthase MnmA [Firmicutes bacterium HGW-Firmicutes-15]|nr:MAG: tRNA 2-thiouridine(34) synthase MnmA [Firmicutes bacterium HGW-Firmicutes-15]